jgi:20S proteasome alpha/beta subunit
VQGLYLCKVLCKMCEYYQKVYLLDNTVGGVTHRDRPVLMSEKASGDDKRLNGRS